MPKPRVGLNMMYITNVDTLPFFGAIKEATGD